MKGKKPREPLQQAVDQMAEEAEKDPVWRAAALQLPTAQYTAEAVTYTAFSTICSSLSTVSGLFFNLRFVTTEDSASKVYNALG